MQQRHFVIALDSVRNARSIPGFRRAPAVLTLWSELGLNTVRSGVSDVRCVRQFKDEHSSGVRSACFSPDSHFALSAEEHTYRIWIWGLGNGNRLRAIEIPHCADSIYISPDGRLALSAGWRGETEKDGGYFSSSSVCLWDVATGSLIRMLAGHMVPACFSPDGRWVLAQGPDKKLHLFDTSTGACVRTVEGHREGVQGVCFSKDERWILSLGSDNVWPEKKTLRVWDLSTGRCVRILDTDVSAARRLALSADGKFVLTGGEDKAVRLLEVATGRCLQTLVGHKRQVNDVCISPDGRWALSAAGDSTWNDDNTIRLWDLTTGQCLRVLQGHSLYVTSVCFSADSRYILSGGKDCSLQLWECEWDLEARDAMDWDEGARPYLETFLTLHCPYGEDGVSRVGKPEWSEDDFQQLLTELQYRGYGWLRPEGVRKKLEEMTANWQGLPPLPWETK